MGICLALAALSLLLPAALTFDPWAWLVWAREIGRLDLDTTGAPSWKPFPALVMTPLAPLGVDAAPAAWLVLSRTIALVGVVAAWRLARRFAGVVAALVAAGLLLLTPDGDPRFLRLVAEGHVSPLTITFALSAVQLHLDGRPRAALASGWCAALIRPEAWPFLLLYGLWSGWRDPATRVFVTAVLVSVPVLWFGGDWLGSGDAWHGADVARVDASASIGSRTVEAVGVAVGMVPIPAWPLAGVAVETARRRREGPLLVLAVGAVAWTLVVIGMAVVLGYAALGRFMLPAAGALCVLAGVGAARSLGVGLRRRSPVHRAAWAAGLVLVVALALPRVVGVGSVLDAVAARGALADDLALVVDRSGGVDSLASCGPVAVSSSGLLRPSVAWRLDLALHDVRRVRRDHVGGMILRAGSDLDLEVGRRDDVVELARTADWVAYRVGC